MTIKIHLLYNNKVKKFMFEISKEKLKQLLLDFDNNSNTLFTIGPISFLKENLLLLEVI